MAGVLADIVLRAVEEQKLGLFQSDVMMYVRYIDDILVVWNNAQRLDDFIREFMLDHYVSS